MWGVVHVVLGRKDSSQLGWQGRVGQVDSLQQRRRGFVILASGVATQSQTVDGVAAIAAGTARAAATWE